MLSELMTEFSKLYNVNHDKIILDRYSFNIGAIIYVNADDSFNTYVINKKDADRDELKQFARKDYLSFYACSNKAVADKRIQSNSFTALFTKTVTLLDHRNGKTDIIPVIDNYYSVVENLSDKYKSKQNKALFAQFEEYSHSPQRIDMLNKCRAWVLNNLDAVIDSVIANDVSNKPTSYTKIFFDLPEEVYEKESLIHMTMTVFNSNDYNTEIDGQIMGLSGANMGLNAKKPYLENKSRPNKLPFMLTGDDAVMTKKFFDWLKNAGSPYHGKIGHEAWPEDYAVYEKGTETVITDYDVVPDDRNVFKTLVVRDHLNRKNGEPTEIRSLQEMEQQVDSLLYSRQLVRNYFFDVKVSQYVTSKMQTAIIQTKDIMRGYFHKKQQCGVLEALGKFGNVLIVDRLLNGAGGALCAEAYNLKLSIINYLKGDETMSLKQYYQEAEAVLSGESVDEISPELFYFLSGQAAYFILSKNESAKKMHSLAEPFFNCATSKQLKRTLKDIFEQYSHALSLHHIRLNRAMAAIQAHGDTERMNDCSDSFLAGYLADNLFFKKEA